jgi:arylsulfatase A-like enzyme
MRFNVWFNLLAILILGIANYAFAAEKPNILIIVADDLGYHDVGFHGGKEIPTPNIDSIAAGGVKCTSGYVSCPVCSPTRAGLLTGRYQQRFGHEFNPGQAQFADGVDFGLPLSEKTIANALHDAGYVTANVGKWHLGNKEKFWPPQRGFDEWYGFLGGAHPYVPRADGKAVVQPIYRDGKAIDMPKHLTKAFGDEAAAFIGRQKEQPFFLYLTFNAVHNPLQPDAEHRAKFDDLKSENPKRQDYAGLLSGLDDAVGTVLEALRKSGKEENTLVFFISDNGGPQKANGSDNTPLRGDKSTVWEGGIRIPYAVQWKGKLPAGKTYDQPVISLDISATAAAAAGAKLGGEGRSVDGVNLLPYLLGESKDMPHQNLYWRFGPQHAIRQGNFKLVKPRNEPAQLYDLAADIGEKEDLATKKPEVLAQLKQAYDAWNAELAEPLWRPARARRAQRNNAQAN